MTQNAGADFCGALCEPTASVLLSPAGSLQHQVIWRHKSFQPNSDEHHQQGLFYSFFSLLNLFILLFLREMKPLEESKSSADNRTSKLRLYFYSPNDWLQLDFFPSVKVCDVLIFSDLQKSSYFLKLKLFCILYGLRGQC